MTTDHFAIDRLHPSTVASAFSWGRMTMLNKARRLIDKVRRLREVDNELHLLREQIAALRADNQRLGNELAGCLRDRGRAAAGRGPGPPGSPRRAARLKEQLDLLKSHLTIGPELFDQFRRWKAANPIPVEPLVSVCVCTYNRGRLLTERCIPSILGQSYRKLELIVVGDACTDDTASRVAAIRDPRLRFVNLARRGDYPADPWRRWMVAGSAPANEALTLARGDFITHLDDDDEHTPDRLEKLVAFVAAGHYDFVWHPFWWETQPEQWQINEAAELEIGHVTTSAILYRGWLCAAALGCAVAPAGRTGRLEPHSADQISRGVVRPIPRAAAAPLPGTQPRGGVAAGRGVNRVA